MSRHPLTGILLIAPMLLSACAQVPSKEAPERLLEDLSTIGQRGEETGQPSDPAPTEPTDEATTAEANNPEPRSLTIALDQQQFTYREGEKVVRTGPISSGAAGYPTPTGSFSVLSKDKDKVSSRYTNQLGWQAWMPYAIQFNGHYFLHEGWLPGYPDSHGCVRVGEQDARFLFDRLKVGDKVEVVGQPPAPPTTETHETS